MKDADKPQRDTKQRRMICDAVMKRCDHPNADEIYLDVHAQDSRISKATVYRNLKVLSDNGEITHVRVPGADRYDSTLRNHYHIICMQCGKVIDAPIKYEAARDRFVETETGFLIRRHRAVFEGLCPDCRKKNSEAAEHE